MQVLGRLYKGNKYTATIELPLVDDDLMLPGKYNGRDALKLKLSTKFLHGAQKTSAAFRESDDCLCLVIVLEFSRTKKPILEQPDGRNAQEPKSKPSFWKRASSRSTKALKHIVSHLSSRSDFETCRDINSSPCSRTIATPSSQSSFSTPPISVESVLSDVPSDILCEKSCEDVTDNAIETCPPAIDMNFGDNVADKQEHEHEMPLQSQRSARQVEGPSGSLSPSPTPADYATLLDPDSNSSVFKRCSTIIRGRDHPFPVKSAAPRRASLPTNFTQPVSKPSRRFTEPLCALSEHDAPCDDATSEGVSQIMETGPSSTGPAVDPMIAPREPPLNRRLATSTLLRVPPFPLPHRTLQRRRIKSVEEGQSMRQPRKGWPRASLRPLVIEDVVSPLTGCASPIYPIKRKSRLTFPRRPPPLLLLMDNFHDFNADC